MNQTTLLVMLVIVSAANILSGCATAVVGGAAAGASVVHDRRTTGVMIDDQEIELRAMKLLHDHPEIDDRSNISTTSFNLVVLLTGQAENAEITNEFARMISQMPRVKKVHNEVIVAAEKTFSESTNDMYLTSRAKLALFDVDLPDFDPSRIKIVTSQETVYMMGIVTRAEAQAASDKVRYVSGVKHVVKVFEYID